MRVVRGVIAAAVGWRGHRIGGLGRYRYVCAGDKALRSLYNLKAFANESRKRFKALEESQAKTKKTLEELQKELEDGRLTRIMQPLYHIDITIRRHFFTNYRKWKAGKPGHGDKELRKIGHEGAYHGNVMMDSLMIRHSHIDDTHWNTFHELYGITHDTAQLYLGIYPFA